MRANLFITLGCVALCSAAYADPAAGTSDPLPADVNDDQTHQMPANVYFDFDSTELDATDQASLKQVVDEVQALSGSKIVLDAHADVRGTSPYNVGLSIRRAEKIRDHLTSRGVAADRIIMAAYGEDGPRRKSFALDRRVTISLTAEPLYSIIDHSGPFVTTVVWNEPVTYAEIEGPVGRKIDQTARR
jgi:outer membrane protein OmpA-like peptidoglycan-associated protein